MKGRDMTAYISFVVGNRFFVDDVTNRMADLGIAVSGFFSTFFIPFCVSGTQQHRFHNPYRRNYVFLFVYSSEFMYMLYIFSPFMLVILSLLCYSFIEKGCEG